MELAFKTQAFGTATVQTVNGRDLHASLGVKLKGIESAMADTYLEFKDKFGTFGAAALLLDEVTKIADADAATKVLHLFQNLGYFPCELIYLKNAVDAELFYRKAAKHDQSIRESDVQKHFYLNLHHYLPNAIRVDTRLLPGSTPDGFVSVNGDLAPVEVKLDLFGERALAQLLGYMRRYGTNTGIAVAQRLKANLPSNVLFVKVNHSEATA